MTSCTCCCSAAFAAAGFYLTASHWRHERKPDRLVVHELLAQDVCVPAVLGELAQRVEVYPAQRERAAPVAVDHVVEPQG